MKPFDPGFLKYFVVDMMWKAIAHWIKWCALVWEKLA